MNRSAPLAAAEASRRCPTIALDLAAICIVWCAMVALVDPVGDFPINDDWVYGAAVRSILNGRFEVYSFSSANLGLMAFWGAAVTKAFGFSFTALRFSTLLVGLVGVLVTYLLVRRVVPQRIVGLIVALMIAVNPVYFALACSFMTDVPFFTLLIGAILAIVVSFERGQDRWTILGLGLGLAALSIRQFAIVLFFGYALGRIARGGFRWRPVLQGVVPLIVAFAFNAGFSAWLVDSGRKAHVGGIASQVTLANINLGVMKWSSLTTIVTLGLFLLPVALLRMRTGRWSKLAIASFVLIAGGISAVVAERHLTVPMGENILQWYGIGPLTNADTLTDNANLPQKSFAMSTVWCGLTVLAIISAAWMLVALAATMRLASGHVRRILFDGVGTIEGARLWFFIGIGASYLLILVVIAATGFAVFDRYLVPLVIVVVLLMPAVGGDETRFAWATRRGPILATSVMLVLTGAFTIVGVHDFLSWSRVRWSALQSLVASGVSPQRIDGGYEFNGWTLYDPLYQATPVKSWWWVDDDEYMTSSGPRPGYSLVAVYPVDRWWKAAGHDVVLLHRSP